MTTLFKCIASLSVLLLGVSGCGPKDPNLNASGTDILEAKETTVAIPKTDSVRSATYYVPIYSDIYVDVQNQETLLAATLSIRNTNETYPLYVNRIDYHHTEGQLLKSYLETTIKIPPLGTINYVIDREDDTGGPGANFMVDVFSNPQSSPPLIQSIMIGLVGNKGFAFSTDGLIVSPWGQ